MMNLVKTLIAVSTSVLLSSCFDLNDDDVSYQSCTAPEATNQLQRYLQDEYFWNESIPEGNYGDSFENLFQAMYFFRAPEDRFSFVLTAEEYADYQASIFFGYGFSHQYAANDEGLLIRYVYDQGSAAASGLRRGDIIVSINDVPMPDIIADVRAGRTTLSTVLGPNEDGHQVDFEFKKPTGNVIAATMTKGSVSANTVMATQVKSLTVGETEKKVGYLVFDSFDNKSEQELNDSFTHFAEQKIDEMVLDLRYNGGGLIRVAKQLSTQMVGDNVEGEVFVKYVHNEKQSNRNAESYFSLGAGIDKLKLDRVVVLTTGRSCSASELVINALSPFVDVVTVGSTTCGKPVGMYPHEMCDHVVFAINFQTQNAAGFGDYFDGLPVDCPVTEQIVGDWGSEQDPLLAEGLHYLQNNRCSASAIAQRNKPQIKEHIDFTKGPLAVKNRL